MDQTNNPVPAAPTPPNLNQPGGAPVSPSVPQPVGNNPVQPPPAPDLNPIAAPAIPEPVVETVPQAPAAPSLPESPVVAPTVPSPQINEPVSTPPDLPAPTITSPTPVEPVPAPDISAPSMAPPPPLGNPETSQPADQTPLAPPPPAPDTINATPPMSPPSPPIPPGATPPPSAETPPIQPQVASVPARKSLPIKRVAMIVGAVILLAVVGFGAFAFMSSRSSNTANNVSQETPEPVAQGTTITYWGLWESPTIMQPIFDEFETQTGIKVDYKQNSYQDYRERLRSAIAKGEGPDVFRFHNTWVPMFSDALDTVPNSVMTPEEYQETFYPVISRDLALEKSYAGIPIMIDGLGLYYNKDIFDTAGKNPPLSWNELRSDLARDLTIRNGSSIERAGVALGLTSNVDHYSDILALMLLQNGADPANPTDSLSETAVAFYQIFANQDGVWNSTFPNSTYAFATESVAMMIAPAWRAHEVAEINPELNFEIAPVPQLPLDDDEDPITWASYWVEGVWKDSPNTTAAWQLLEFLSTKETLTELNTLASQERLFWAPYPRVDMKQDQTGDPYTEAFVLQAENAISWPMASRTFDNGLNDNVIKYYEDALNAGGDTAALSTVQQGISQVFTRYNIPAGFYSVEE